MIKLLKTNIYFGAPLFSESELMYNEFVVKQIREKFGDSVAVYLPQENEAINDKSGYADSVMIADGDTAYLEEADVLVAVIDGQTVDVGLATEIGIFYNTNRPIIAIYSDSRQGTFGNEDKIKALDEIAESQFSYVNLYTVGIIKKRGHIVRGYEEMLEALDSYIPKD